MRQFNYDDEYEENFFPDTGDDQPSEEDVAELLERREQLDLIQLDLVDFDLQQKLLSKAIKMCEKSFWWRFKSNTSRLVKINETYHILKSIITPPSPEQES